MRVYNTFFLILLLSLFTVISCKKFTGSKLVPITDKPFEQEINGEIDPIASPDARKGGVISLWGSGFPRSLNYWLDQNGVSGEIMGLLFEPLAELHVTENKMVGILADSWTISPDKKTFVFKIRPDAAWSDGKPVVAEDFQFFYDVIMNKKYLTTVFRVELARLERPEVIDSKTVKIRAKGKHWSNFDTAAGLIAFPKHLWEKKDFNKVHFQFPVVSGPYRVREVKKNRYVLLQRNGDWWGRAKKYNKNKYNFDYIRFRFISDRDKALESFKKGNLDIYPIYTASIWAKKTNFEEVQKNWVVRQRIFNRQPRGFQGFTINMRRPIFQDIRVRKALCYLLNRKSMNDKFMYNEYFLLNSYYPDLHPDNKNPSAPFYEYNPVKARELLRQAGWNVGAEGILEKNGEQFEIKFLSAAEEKRHLELYLSDLKSVGIKATIDQTSWATASKRLDEHDYDLYWVAWGAGRLRDPEPSWHSATADEKASNNLSGVKDAAVDRLVEQQKTEFSLDRRNDILQKLDTRLNAIIPYVLLWQIDHTRILYWNRFGRPAHVLGKYSNESSVLLYWWFDENRKSALEGAMKNGEAMPAEPDRIEYRGP